MRRKTFALNRGRARTTELDFYESSDADKLRQKYPGFLDNPDNSCIEIGFDSFNPFNFAQWSTPLVGIRYRDMPEVSRNRKENVQPLIVVQGPEKPPSMYGCFEPLRRELELYGPGSPEGLLVKSWRKNDAGRVVEHEFSHRILLTAAFADTPARHDLAGWLGHTAYLGCGFCWFKPSRLGNKMSWDGYAATKLVDAPHRSVGCPPPPEIPNVPFHQQPRPSFVTLSNNPSLLYSSQFQSLRGSFSRDPDDLAAVGATGPSALLNVPGLPFESSLLVSTCHAFLASSTGIVAKFVSLFFTTVKRGAVRPWYAFVAAHRSLIDEKGLSIRYPSQINRPYRSVVKRRGMFTMEDWLRFVESPGPVLFDGILPLYVVPRDVRERALAQIRTIPGAPVFQLADISLSYMWKQLRHVVLFIFRAQSFTEAQLQEAEEALRRFSILAEILFPSELCTHNLHLLSAHLWKQIRSRGAACRDLEFWVERLMQDAKSNLKVRALADH